ncbi:MAG: mqo [Myxococcaceae bacterium]|nr:mqo [Myxococcaceae bacterium]
MGARDGGDAAEECDVLLVGAGIMSATVGLLLKELDPSLRVAVYERADRVAAESSDARNNAGTGHSALCELNYTPEGEDGAVDVRKAVKIMECFEVSKQLWAWLVARGCFDDPGAFIRAVPHLSFVRGEADCDFLLRRFAALQSCPLFYGMKYSEAPEDLAGWMPLVMAGRDPAERVAATRSELGTDVDFGALARGIFAHLGRAHGVKVHLDCAVKSLAQEADGRWAVGVHDEIVDERRAVRARFVFLGAGGGALDLLNESDIPEGDGYGGFPVSGQWLVCTNPAVVARHHAKVYGKAGVGAPPMSVPHLDSRFIDGERTLMFGPFAGFSTRFLKEGSYFDLPLSLTPDNLLPMLGAGIRNLALTRYLVGQVLMGFDEKVAALREFVPDASPDDWELTVAGQRVQVIKKDEAHGGRLEFGTEIISARDNTLAALLGASPGASTAASIALDLLADCFPERMATAAWQAKLREMIPSYGRRLADEPDFARALRARTHATLGLPR